MRRAIAPDRHHHHHPQHFVDTVVIAAADVLGVVVVAIIFAEDRAMLFRPINLSCLSAQLLYRRTDGWPARRK